MAKYSTNFKLEVINYYKEGHSYSETIKKYNIPDKSIPRMWVHKFDNHGMNGILKKKEIYDGNFKKYVIEYMHQNHLSKREATYKFNLGSVCVISRWEQIYNEEGPQALYQEQRGKRNNMNRNVKDKNISNKKEQELLKKIKKLEMENEYLKKLNALVQKRIKRENKKK